MRVLKHYTKHVCLFSTTELIMTYFCLHVGRIIHYRMSGYLQVLKCIFTLAVSVGCLTSQTTILHFCLTLGRTKGHKTNLRATFRTLIYTSAQINVRGAFKF